MELESPYRRTFGTFHLCDTGLNHLYHGEGEHLGKRTAAILDLRRDLADGITLWRTRSPKVNRYVCVATHAFVE
jgi:hypothetical protein